MPAWFDADELHGFSNTLFADAINQENEKENMSKNLTRKSLAFGAIIALGTSLFAGTAANAADELTLVPSAGTSYNTIEGETFTLLSGLAPTTPAGNTVQLKYQAVTTTGVTLTGSVNGAGTTTYDSASATPNTQAANTYVFRETATPTVGARQTLALGVTSAIVSGTPATATVTAFFDANNNNKLDAGEYTSAARTVKWSDVADVTATVVLTTPSEGDTSVSATVALADVNQEQISETHIAVSLTNGSDTALTGSVAAARAGLAPYGLVPTSNLVTPAALASGSYKATLSSLTIGTSGGVKARAYYLVTATAAVDFIATGASKDFATYPATGVVKLNEASKAITARTIATIKAYATASANNLANTGLANASSGNVAVRPNSEFTLSAIAKDATPAAVSGIAVKAAIALGGGAPTLDATHTITVNGTAYSTAASLAAASPLALTTGADGIVAVKISTVGWTAGATATIAVTFTAQGYSSDITAVETAVAYDLYADNAVSASTYRSVVKGETIATGYTLVDQFKQIPASGNFRLVATAANTTGTPVTAGATYVAFASGKATVSYSPATAGVFTLTPTVEVQNATTLNWGAQALNSAAAALTINSIAAQTDAVSATAAYSYAATARTSADVASSAMKAIDTRLSYDTVATYTLGEVAKVSGTATESISGTGRSGVLVTVSGAGLLFSNSTLTQNVNANDTYTAGSYFKADSITVAAANDGTYAVTVLANKAGTYTVTVTAGNATKTATVKFASTLAAASISLTVPATQAQAGQSIGVSATTLDKYGNAVSSSNVTFTVAGSGYIQNIAAVTPTSGVATNRLIVLGSDLGTSTVTASIVDPADATKTIASTKSMEIGITDADVTVGGKAIYASAEFAKGKTVTVIIDGKRLYSKLQTSDAYTELRFTQKVAGKHTVTVRVSGGVVVSETVVTTK